MLIVLRYVLPGALVLVGVVILIAGDGSDTAVEGWALFTGAGVTVFLLNFLFRMGVEGDKTRDREEAARDYFDEHGHWPDEAPRG
ncbi:MAG: hypothetical protein WD844_14060 [Thermoleophilaceae bacterium]